MVVSHLFTAVVVVVNVMTTIAVDPCQSYAELNDPKRSSKFVPANTDLLLCDRSMRDGWYRFTSQSGGQMPTSCVDMFHCGTHAPIWMQGAHPAVADGEVNRKACINMPNFNPNAPKDCCSQSHQIKVKNCGSYFVYYLTRVRGCSMAYCAGNAEPCPSGTYSASGFPPCSKDAFPKMTANPKMTGPNIVANKQSFNFKCEVSYSTKEDGNFEITWLFDHKPVTSIPPIMITGKDRFVELDQRFLAGNMGKLISCQVRSFYKKGLMSNPVESSGYWVGVEVSPTQIVVGEGDQGTNVTLTSTIPIVCVHRFSCAIDFELDIDSTDPNELVAAEACSKQLKDDDWDPIKKSAQVSFDVMAVRDFKKDKNKRLALKFKPIFSFSPQIWNNYALTPTTVITKDQGTQRCTATGDPHIQGFDQKSSYHLYRTGEFVFYKATTRPFEVQVRTWICGRGNVACNCGVIAREGNDVVEIDICHGRYGKSFPKVNVRSKNKLLEGTTIKRSSNGRSFQLNFPSGASVKADTSSSSMNLYLQAPSDDFRATAGVCGTFDGNAKNDFTKPDGNVHSDKDRYPNPFFESWRIPYGKSLFDSVPDPQQQYEYNPQYCVCNKKTGKVDCRAENKVNDPAKKATKTWKDLTDTLNKKTRLRRSTDFHDLDTDEDAFYVFNYGNDFKPDIPKFPTPSGMTALSAGIYCKEQLQKSSVFAQCSKQKDIDMKTFIEDCVEDLKIADDLSFAKDSVAAMENACQQVVLQDPANYAKGDNGTEIPPAFIVEDLCPDNCNNRGKCTAGDCKCDAGFTGVDCAIVVSKPPTVLEVTRPVCDIRKRPCQTVFLITENVMDTPKLACRVREVEMVNGKPSSKPGAYKATAAEFESFAEVSCQLPSQKAGKGKPSMGYLISITNDGKLFSDEQLFIAHDSLCQMCTVDLCLPKPNTCLIEGRCYSAFDTAIGAREKICDPAKSANTWSIKKATGLNKWTATSTGCMCDHSPIVSDCACCTTGGCQCGEKNKDKCVECGNLDTCGKN